MTDKLVRSLDSIVCDIDSGRVDQDFCSKKAHIIILHSLSLWTDGYDTPLECRWTRWEVIKRINLIGDDIEILKSFHLLTKSKMA